MSSPEPPRFRICLQVFGYWLAPIAESCLGENDLTLDGVFTLTGSALISEQQPILIVAVLENIGDLSAAEADVQMITITLS